MSNVKNLIPFEITFGLGGEYTVWAESKSQAEDVGEAVSNRTDFDNDEFAHLEGTFYRVVEGQMRPVENGDLIATVDDCGDVSVAHIEDTLTEEAIAELNAIAGAAPKVDRLEHLLRVTEPPSPHAITSLLGDVQILVAEVKRLRAELAAKAKKSKAKKSKAKKSKAKTPSSKAAKP